MSVLDRKLLREMRSSAGLLVAITCVITLGVMCFIYMRSAYNNLSLARWQYYSQCRMADFWVDFKKAPLGDLEDIAAMPGVTGVRPRIQFFATVDIERSPIPLNGLVLSLPDAPGPVINDIVLKQGGYFTSRRENEVIVGDAFARRNKLHPGQWIHLILNNRRQELFIVGTAISCEFVYPVGPGAISPDPEHFGIFYLKRTYAEEIFDFSGAANQLVGTLAPNAQERPEQTLREIETPLASYGVTTTTPRGNQSSNRFLSDEIRGLGVFASFFPFIFLAVGALVLNVVMVRLIEQQRLVIGTLKAIGYHDSQIFAHFTKLGLVVGLVGGAVGLGLGNMMAEVITGVYRMFYEFPDLKNQVYPGLYATGLAISVVFSMVGASHGAYVAMRLNPAEAMRTKPPVVGGAVWLEKFPWLWGQLSFGWRLTLRNVLRNRLRTAVGVFASASGAALLVCGFMLYSALQYLVNFQFEQVTHSDVDLTFTDEHPLTALLEARRLPGVRRAEPLFDLACTFVHGAARKRGAITGLDPAARLTTPRDVAGRTIRIPSAGLAMSRRVAELLDLDVGDRVMVLPVKGRRAPLEMPVVEISNSFIGLGVYCDIRYLSRLVSEELAVSGVQLLADSQPALRSELYRELKRLPAVRSVNVRAQVIENLRIVIKAQRIFVSLLVIFAGVIFFCGLLNASLIALAERRREVATLRVLGYGPWQVGGLFLRESLLVNCLGTLVGMPLGYFLSVIISIVYNTDMFRFPLISPPEVWWGTISLSFVFALLAHAFVQRNVHRLDWLEASKTRE